MVSTQDRPIPAPRISLLDRKPPVPKRTLQPQSGPVSVTPVIPKPRTCLPGKSKRPSNYSLFQNLHPLLQTSSDHRVPVRRVHSLPNASLNSRQNFHRSFSCHFYPNIFCSKNVEFSHSNSYQDEEEVSGCAVSTDVSGRSSPGEIPNSERIVEQGRVARIAKMLESSLPQNATPVRRFLATAEPRTSSISINSVAGYSFPSVTEKSKYLLGNISSTVSDIVDENYGNGTENLVTSDLDSTVPPNSFWNPGYIGLEEYTRLAELSCDGIASTSNGPAKNFDSLDNIDGTSSVGDLSTPTTVLQSVLEESVRFEDGNMLPENLYLSEWAEVTVNKKNRGRLLVVVEESALACWTNDEKDGDPALGPYYLKNLIYIGKNPVSDTVELHIRENLLCSHWANVKLSAIAGANSWILNIAKHIMPKNELLLYSIKSLEAGGSVWIRQGTACPWSSGWMFLNEHKLYYVVDNCAMLFELDVRKFIGMKSSISKVDWCASVVGSTKGPFLLLQEGGSLFVQAEYDLATSTWIDLLKHQMEECTGYRLEDSKLTADDVPVIVDRCIKFISTYGLQQPGLYRRNGPNVEVRLLLAEFRKDPVNVHLLPESDDTINVVADVLRSFFRQLDSPLVPYHIQDRLFAVANVKGSTRLDEYHEILMGLPRIRLQTLRRVLDHLKDVTEHASVNLATIENVAKVFGPTLFSVDQGKDLESSGFAGTIPQVNLVKELLTYYAAIFRISAREMSIKSRMNMFQGKANQIKARADGFLVPVHILEKDNHTFNVQSSANAEQVCDAARNRPVMRNEADVNSFALFEEIKCGQLERRVNPPEKMGSMITGRWLDWEPAECFLLFKRDPIPYSFRVLYPFADDVRIAEPGAKSFNVGHLKLEGGLVAYYNKALKKINEWHTDDILWYIGHENSRKPPYPYTLTFILPKTSSFKYKSKNMGYCVAFREATLRTQWLNAVVSSQQDFRENSSMPLVQI